MSTTPPIEKYRGYRFQVFDLPDGCEGCGATPGQWNANMYDPGWSEPIGYCFEPQGSEEAMRAYLKGRIDSLVEGQQAPRAVERYRNSYRSALESTGLSPAEFRRRCEALIREWGVAEPVPMNWHTAAQQVKIGAGLE